MSYSDLQPEDLESWVSKLEVSGLAPAILDMRDAASMQAGIVPGALPADEGQIRKLMKTRHRPVLVYCYHGHSSRDLAGFLSQMGLSAVYNLEGGWQAYAAWQDRCAAATSPALQNWLETNGFRNKSLYARIDSGMTPLMVAALDGSVEITAELLELGAEINAVNFDGNQALWMACVAESSEIIALLLTAGADLNHRNDHGFSALMYAASSGKLAVVEQLLAAGADATIESPDGLNALECAATLPVLKRLRSAVPAH